MVRSRAAAVALATASVLLLIGAPASAATPRAAEDGPNLVVRAGPVVLVGAVAGTSVIVVRRRRRRSDLSRGGRAGR